REFLEHGIRPRSVRKKNPSAPLYGAQLRAGARPEFFRVRRPALASMSPERAWTSRATHWADPPSIPAGNQKSRRLSGHSPSKVGVRLVSSTIQGQITLT